jgi:hypothetical protein
MMDCSSSAKPGKRPKRAGTSRSRDIFYEQSLFKIKHMKLVAVLFGRHCARDVTLGLEVHFSSQKDYDSKLNDYG